MPFPKLAALPLLGTLALDILVLPTAHAEIAHTTLLTHFGIRPAWWPVLPIPPGWHQDTKAGNRLNAYALLPDGETWSSAPATITGTAQAGRYGKPATAISALMADDAQDAHDRDPDLTIQDEPTLTDGDGQTFRACSITPKNPKRSPYSRIAYGTEGQFLLTFTLNAKTRTALNSALPAFQTMIATYRERPNRPQPR